MNSNYNNKEYGAEPSGCEESSQMAGAVATIGFFDGVHLGHRFLVGQVLEEARRRGLGSTLVTFADHPARVLHPERPLRLLTSAEEKAEMLGELGADHLVLLPFTKELAALSAHDFMRRVLMEQLGVRVLVVGYDHRFGHNRAEDFNDYVRYGREMGMEVVRARELNPERVLADLPQAGFPVSSISSSTIRRALGEGNVGLANACLGYRYFVRGRVVDGFRNGHRIGFPTANIEPDSPQKLLPRNGVYAVDVRLEDGTEGRGMLNIGTRPTFHNGGAESVEVHIFDFEEDIYNERIEVRFRRFVRQEREFDSPEALRAQLERDEAECRRG